jgi:hypothetical protein
MGAIASGLERRASLAEAGRAEKLSMVTAARRPRSATIDAQRTQYPQPCTIRLLAPMKSRSRDL